MVEIIAGGIKLQLNYELRSFQHTSASLAYSKYFYQYLRKTFEFCLMIHSQAFGPYYDTLFQVEGRQCCLA